MRGRARSRPAVVQRRGADADRRAGSGRAMRETEWLTLAPRDTASALETRLFRGQHALGRALRRRVAAHRVAGTGRTLSGTACSRSSPTAGRGRSAMPESHSLLGALQYADSFFPSGSMRFPGDWKPCAPIGNRSSAEPVAKFVEGQLVHRWASLRCARARCRVSRGGDKFDRLADLDDSLEAMTLATELREGSRRAGASLLKVHAGLGTPGAAEYRQSASRHARARGHLPVVQGIVVECDRTLRGRPVAPCPRTRLCTGIVGAALRLGMIGHLDAQKILLQVRPVLVELLRAASRACRGVVCLHAARRDRRHAA